MIVTTHRTYLRFCPNLFKSTLLSDPQRFRSKENRAKEDQIIIQT